MRMKLPADSIVRPEKITEYLLKPRARNDKSKFLNELGYNLDDWTVLRDDILMQFLPKEAHFDENTPYGDMYHIEADLLGPNGKTRKVLTVWLLDTTLGQAHLVTMYPAKET